MSTHAQVAALEELASIDASILRVDEQLEVLQDGLAKTRSEVEDLETRISVGWVKIAEMDRARSDLMSELRQMSAQLERAKEKLGRARNKREVNASQRELTDLQQLHRARSKELDQLNSMADRERSAIDDAEIRRAALAGELTGVAEGVGATLSAQKAAKAKLTADRTRVIEMLSPKVYRRYEWIRARRPIAVAQLQGDTCQGCHVTLIPMMVQKVRLQRDLEQCPNCHRILYHCPPRDNPSSARLNLTPPPMHSSPPVVPPVERTLPAEVSVSPATPTLPMVGADSPRDAGTMAGAPPIETPDLVLQPSQPAPPPLIALAGNPPLPHLVDSLASQSAHAPASPSAERSMDPTADPDELADRVRRLSKVEFARPVGQPHAKKVSGGSRAVYERCPYVKAWVLREARGCCELCGCVAPFESMDGSPYLEVHHVRQLAEGGPDTPENAVAVCANCHRRLHYGSDRNQQRLQLYRQVARLERCDGDSDANT